jgi:hypothetical protein
MTQAFTIAQQGAPIEAPQPVRLATGETARSDVPTASPETDAPAWVLIAAVVACALGAGVVVFGLRWSGRRAGRNGEDARLGADARAHGIETTAEPRASSGAAGEGASAHAAIAPSEGEVLARAARALGLTQGALGAMHDHAARRGLASPLGLVLGDAGGEQVKK